MEFCGSFILNAVKDYPFLYNKRHPDRKDRDKKLQAWNEIDDIFGIGDPCTRSRDRKPPSRGETGRGVPFPCRVCPAALPRARNYRRSTPPK
ncbi:hypothetical protein HPB47_016441 [Ixodes persulcatus]|uniref:Uncharacterized protein n=1 Tax=Ixodes persulcatus TaxID=34615 RepID=A0AC60QQX3_IXOPE|nr:hypothetical protein HPB47_016441 [Ixodes persulcatus]